MSDETIHNTISRLRPKRNSTSITETISSDPNTQYNAPNPNKRHLLTQSNDIYVTFNSSNRGSSVLFIDRLIHNNKSSVLQHTDSNHVIANGATIPSNPTQSFEEIIINTGNHGTVSPRNLLALPIQSIHRTNSNPLINTDQHVIVLIDSIHSMPRYCSILKHCLLFIGVLRIDCGKQHHGMKYCISYIWPAIVFLYQLVNLFLVTITYNNSIETGTRDSSWLRYLSDALSSCAVITGMYR